MKKKLLFAFALALLVPWATRAQDCTQTVPYTEGFEGVTGTAFSTAGSLPACWNGFTNGTSTGYVPHVVTGTANYSYQHSGINSLVMTSGSGATYGNTKVVMLPPMSVALNQLQLSFWMCTESSSYGTLIVGYVTSDDTSTFTAIQSYPASSASVHSGNGLQATAGMEVELSLASVPASATRLAFKWYHNSTYYTCCVDDVVISYPPTCPKVDSLTVSPASNSAEVAWVSASNATSWVIVVTDSMGVVDSSNVMTNPATVYNLTPNTDYEVTVRAICGDGDWSLPRSTTFRTACSVVATEDLPWTYGFEDATGTTATATFNPCLGRHVVGSTSNYPYPSANHRSGSKGLNLWSNASGYSWLTLPLFEESLSSFNLSFYAYRAATATYGYWAVGVMTDPNNITTFDTIASGQVSANSQWEHIELSLAEYNGTGTYLAILCPQGTAVCNTYIDDITVGYPSACATPLNVDTSNVTANTVDLTWSGSTSEYIVEYGLIGFQRGTGEVVQVYDNTVTLDGLRMGLRYGVYINGICGDDTSAEAYTSFNTGCSTIAEDDLPYVEDFETYGTGTGNPINACWTKGTNATSTYPYPYSTAAINGSRGLYFYSTRPTSSGTRNYSWAALPMVDESVEMNTLQVNFNAKRYSSTTNTYFSMIAVGIADSVTNLTTATALDSLVTWIDTIDLTSLDASSVTSEEVSFANYTGEGRYVVFFAPQPTNSGTSLLTNYISIDDIVLRRIPSCFWPTSVVLDTVTTDSAAISWTPDPRTPSPSYWEVEYGTHGFAPGEGQVETTLDTTFTFLNLDPNTEYDAYITANCGDDVSESVTITFYTKSIPAPLPYFTGFEAGQDSGWVMVNGTQTNRWMIGNYSDTTHVGSRALFISDNGTSSSYNISSASMVFTYRLLEVTDTGDYVINFDWRAYGEGSADYLRAFIIPNSVDILPNVNNGITSATVTPAGWINVGSYSNAVKLNLSNEWQNNQAICHVGTGQTGLYKLVFYWRNDGSVGSGPAIVDNIDIHKITCPAPTNLVADSVGAYQIDLSWTEHGTEVSWEVRMDTGIWIPVTTNSYSATGLTPKSTHTFEVRAICEGEGDTSFISQSIIVQTLRDCGEDNINIVDTIGTGTNLATSNAFYASTSYRRGFTEAIYRAQELNSMGLQENNRIHGIKVRSGATAGTIRQAKIYMKEVSHEGFATTPVANDTVDRTTMTLVYSGDLEVSANSWVEILFDNAFVYSGNSNLMIMFARDTTSTAGCTFQGTSTSPDYLNAYGYSGSTGSSFTTVSRNTNRTNVIFDICTEISNCQRPADVVANASDTEVTLSWTGDANSYEVVIDTASIDPATATAHPVTGTTTTLTGLTPTTTYYYYVRGLCDGGHVSEWSIEGSVTTACAAKSLPYTEDFESYASGSTNPIDPCWTKGTNYTTAYPYPYGTNAVTGYRSLYFYGYKASSSNYYSYAALPLMQDSVRNLMLSFNVRRYATVTDGYTTLLVIGVMTDPGDINTFEPMDTLDLKTAQASSIHGYEYLFNGYTGNGQYIAILAPVPPLYGNSTTCYNYAYVDDILVDHIPTCRRPNNVALGDVSETSATIHWTGTAPSYEIEYGLQGFNLGNGIRVNSNNDSVVLTGLTQGHTYDVYVRGRCSATDSSDWSFAYTFVTVCGRNALPYTEDFERYGSGSAYAIDPCWTKACSGTTAFPYPYSTNAISGERSLYFGAYGSSSSTTSTYYSYAALPLMQDSVKNLALTFNVRRYGTVSDSYTTRLFIGVMTDPNNIATFTPMDTIDLKNAPALSVHGYEYYFNHYTGNGEYIAIYDPEPPLYGTSTTCNSYAYVDDIMVYNIPDCHRPTDVTINNIGQTTATVHWTGNALSYEIEYGPEGFVRGTGIMVTSATDSINLIDLGQGTTYDVYVRGRCSENDSSLWSFACQFTTVCGLNDLPMVMNFDGEQTGTAAPMPNCWVRWNNNMTATYGYFPYVNSASASAHSGTNYAYWYLSTGSTYPSDAMLITPEIDTVAYPMNTIEVSFWAKRSTNAMNLIVGVVQDAEHPDSTFTAVDTIALTTSYAEYNVPFTNFGGYGNRVAFRGVRGSSAVYVYLDDIIIDVISPCERSYDLQAYDATNNSVTLEWEDTIGSTQWVVYYAVDSVSSWSNVTANSNPFTLTGLNANTLYRYRVAPICADGQEADWSRETVRFTTAQMPAMVPYSYDFEAAAEWNNWQTSSNNNVNWYRGNVAQHNSTYAAYISADGGATHSWNMTAATNAVAYRDIDFGPDVHSFQLEFDAYLGGTTDGHNYEGLTVFLADPAIPVASVSTNITSPWGNVNNVELYTVRHDTTWGHYTVYLDGISGVKRLVFYHFNQNTAGSHPFDNNPSAFDNVSITIQPCERPAALSATPLSPYRTAVDWEGDDSATYQVRYRKTNENGYTYRTVTGTTTTLTGLTPSASYYWWVRKVCTLTETDTLVSSWSVRDAFDAPCVSVSVADTLREGFENVNEHGTLYSATDGKMPNCWDSWSSNNATVYPHVTDSGSYSYWVEGNAALTMTSAGSSTNYGTNSYAVLPEIAEPTNSLTLAFWFCMENTSYGELTVGYLTGSDYEHDFVAVKTMAPGANAAHDGNGLQLSRGQRDTVNFDSVPAGNYRLAFRWTKESTFYSVCIDDVAVWTSAPACVAPVIDTIEATDATIAFSWLGTAQTYEVAFAEGEWDDPDSTIAVTGTSFTFTGLQAETRYTIGVRAACSEGVYSNWTLNSITTAEHPCAVPTGLTASNITYTSATLGWTEGEPGQDEWQVHLYGEGLDTIFVSNTLTYDFNGLAHGVTYNFQVRAICTVNRISNWSTSAEFTTIACEGVTNVTVGSVTANSAVISWTAPMGATRFVVNYGLQGFDQGTGSFDTVENATSCTLSGLTANTPYDVYVRTLCEGGTASAWSSVVNFTTSRSTGIDDVNAANVSLYPNPASSTVTLKGIEGKATVTVVDMNGRKAGEWTVNEGELTIDVTDMAQGAYFVRIVGEQVNAIRKLIVR